MPRDAGGAYSRAVAPYAPNTPADANAVNAEMTDIATGLTGSLARDGTGGMLGNLNMGAHKISALIGDNNDPASATRVDQVDAKDAAVSVNHVVNVSGFWPGNNFDPGASEVVFFVVYLPNGTRRLCGTLNMQATAGPDASEMRARLYITTLAGVPIKGPFDYTTLVNAGQSNAASHGFTLEFAAGEVPDGACISCRAYRTTPCAVRTYGFAGWAVI